MTTIQHHTLYFLIDNAIYVTMPVQFIIKRDQKEKFKFASLQSEIGHKLLNQSGMSTEHFDTVVLIKDNTVYTRILRCTPYRKRTVWYMGTVLYLYPVAKAYSRLLL